MKLSNFGAKLYEDICFVQVKLKKDLGLLEGVAIIIGIIVGSGTWCYLSNEVLYRKFIKERKIGIVFDTSV